MARINLKFSFSTILLTIAIAISACSKQTTAIELCSGASDPRLCESLVKGMSDAIEATESIINKLIKEIEGAKKKAGKKGGTNENVELCLKDYDDSISDLKEALKHIKDGDKASAQTKLSGVISSMEACQDAYSEEDSVSPFTKKNNLFKFTADTCLSIYEKA
ncbi:uncharacterized protein LOC126657308 [Mercurialis annua]|uniref:uncharacterized protein LOC126657308 n=1 Tax=Mercurialis annua TaxID=3986 RepID=UPI00215FB4F2|nr:uncharacterized protein LOC126657308 [Mercurialis annua]